MGQSQSKPQDRRGSDSSTAQLVDNSASVEKAYETFYGSATYASVSAAAVISDPPVHTVESQRSHFHPPISAYNTGAQHSFVAVPDIPQGITQPAPPPELYRVSELIDPHDLLSRSASDYHMYGYRNNLGPSAPLLGYSAVPNVHKELPKLVESPSGNLLGAKEFIAHPRRPLAIRELQEQIVQNIKHNTKIKQEAEWIDQAQSTSHGEQSRKGSDSTWASNGRKMSDVEFCSTGRKGSADSFEDQKIQEGRRAYEASKRRKESKSKSPSCLNCFR